MRTRDPDGKRRALVAAGMTVAGKRGLAGLSVNQVVAEAAVSKGSFFHLFGDRAGYLRELHRAFHDQLTADMLAAIDGLPPGRGRLWAATRVYLDGCVQQRAVRALLVEAQAEPVIVHEVAQRNDMVSELATPDFEALGVPRPREAARLWVAMTREVAVAESATGKHMSGLRAALEHYLEGRPR